MAFQGEKLTKLNLGCGPRKIDDFLGIDKVKLPSVDIVHDLNIIPYPFEDNQIDEIFCSHILEHLTDFNRVMEELYRICKSGAIIKVRGPYYKSHLAYGDSTHKHFFTENSFNYFNDAHPFNYYSTARFEVIKKELISHGKKKLIPFKKFFNIFLWNIFDEIYFELMVIKEDNPIPRGEKGQIGERNDVIRSTDTRERTEHIQRYKKSLRYLKPNQFILDVGCGTGYGTKMLNQIHQDVYGIDVSKEAINYAQRNYTGPIYLISNAENIPFKNESFDVVISFESIEHLQNPEKGLKEMNRILKDGGLLFISTPNPRHLGNILKNRLLGIPYPEKVDMNNIYHIKEFNYNEFLDFLGNNGFSINSVYGQTIPFIPRKYGERPLDLARFFPKYAWTIVVQAVKKEIL